MGIRSSEAAELNPKEDYVEQEADGSWVRGRKQARGLGFGAGAAPLILLPDPELNNSEPGMFPETNLDQAIGLRPGLPVP
ncbi:MAG: hypothetical protein ACLP00_28445 [Terracidiphilus sp.]